MPFKVWEEWKAFYILEPFGEDRQDLRTADIVRTMYNIMRDTKKRREPYTLDEMRLRWEGTPPPTPRQKTDEELEAIGRQWAMLGGAFD